MLASLGCDVALRPAASVLIRRKKPAGRLSGGCELGSHPWFFFGGPLGKDKDTSMLELENLVSGLEGRLLTSEVNISRGRGKR